ncbi:LpqB family beta-propeller domain-containing protein [Quadrisphaera sp. DSM 44207]|uniref:LpqB family beta-propeller domain-containing protein n=1 Tax=Quadrisphaera sp. DSM 44207 TaxID=1881057 RepID=UPI000886B534|nr:LpqB family beta-propeller domain-containing protein [Quadrisphaera sp. DSM 44207]SDQ09004.1 Sporulation and spore germination [Quadrisphaera sp. DSM 44207]
MPRRARAPRAALAALAALLVLALAGCASMPTSGPVRAGAAPESGEERRFRVEPVGPAPGSAPLDLVRGFLLAGVGVEDDFATARQYLSADRRGTWRPGARTVVHADGGPELRAEQAGQQLVEDVARARGAAEGAPAGGARADAGPVTVTITVRVSGTVDDRGRYAAAPPGAVEEVRMLLVREEGQWRIAEVPDLLLLDDAAFTLSFRSYQLYFADPARRFLVPEVRWLPDRQAAATTLVTELLRGPSPWLAPGVVTGFPADLPTGTGTARSSVVVADGEARVDLPQRLLDADPDDRGLLQQQLAATLGQLPAVSAVRVTVAGGELGGSRGPVLHRDPAVDPAPVLLAQGALVRLRGGALVPVAGVPALGELGASDPAVLDDRYAVLAAGRSQLLLLTQGAAGAVPEPVVALAGAELTAPSFGPDGWVWSTAAQSGGAVTAVGPDGRVAQVGAPWLAGRRVLSLRSSRDGARVLVASAGAEGPERVRVDVAAVQRDADGAPALLSVEAAPPTPWLTTALEAVWVDEASVAVLGAPAPAAVVADGALAVQVLTGGRAASLGAPEQAGEPVSLAAGSGRASILLAGADGALWHRAGSRWVPVPGAAGADPAHAG